MRGARAQLCAARARARARARCSLARCVSLVLSTFGVGGRSVVREEQVQEVQIYHRIMYHVPLLVDLPGTRRNSYSRRDPTGTVLARGCVL